METLGRGLADIFGDMAKQGCQDKLMPESALLITIAAIRDIVEEVPGKAMLSELVEMIGNDYQGHHDAQAQLTQSGERIAELEAGMAQTKQMLEDALRHLRGGQ